jgi:serine/threonine-protein kinase
MASDVARPVDVVASSVADGSSINWEQSTLGLSDRERRLVSHLRVIEAVSQVYRTLTAEDPDAGGEDSPASHEPAGPRWGRLVLLDRIGRGASADVFRAWDVDLEREVALKLLVDDGMTGDAAANARLLREARRLARVRHPHVVSIYGAERHEGRIGLWMELVRGRTLADIVQNDGVLSPAAAASAVADVCGAVSAVHAAGLLHRDVKAQNVVREQGGRLVLMDLGAGAEMGSHGGLAGTPIYLAPEVLGGHAASVSSDVYSIGVLLFFLITGRYPVAGASMEALVAAHRQRRRAAIADVEPSTPPSLARIVDRALDPDPARRFATASEMEAALRAFVTPHPTAHGPVSWRTWVAVAATAAAVATLVGSVASWRTTPAALPATSIAVLPLTHASANAGTSLVADGLTDELITKLGQIPSLRVTAHTSVQRFKATDRPVSDIASELHVGTVLEGSVEVTPGADRRAHVNLRLIRAGTDVQLWSDSFDRPLGDLAAFETEIARAVARSVHVALLGKGQTGQSARPTTAAAAEAYLEGRAHLSQFAARASDALAAFQRAIAADPAFAPAHAGAARAYIALGFDRRVSQPGARAAALSEVTRAIELQPDLAEAHAALADLKFEYDWDFAGAEREYRRALDLDPSASFAAAQYAQFLASMKRLGEARAAADESVARDPLSPQAELTRALILYYAREWPAALSSANRAESLDAGPTSHLLVGRILEAMGDVQGALRETRLALAGSNAAVGWQAQALRQQALAGDVGAARTAFAALVASPAGEFLGTSPYEAYFRLAVGDPETALRVLARAVAERDPSVLWIDVDPRLDSIRGRPEFRDLRSRIGLR